jgi:hypothetical protein
MRKIDWVVISPNELTLKRGEAISNDFSYNFQTFSNIDSFSEVAEALGEIPLIFIDAEHVQKESDIAGTVQVARQMADHSQLIVSIDGKMDPAAATFLKKSGAHVVLVGPELKSSSKLEFFVSQKVKSSFYPIKTYELIPDKPVPLQIYHLMPLNRKFLPVTRANDVLPADRLQKLSAAGELYIRKEDINLWMSYCDKVVEGSPDSVTKRSRARYLTLMTAYIDLLMMISDQSEFASYDAGNELYKKVQTLSSELLSTLGAVNNAWDVINNSAIGEFGSLERAPAIAAYAGLLSLNSGLGDPNIAMLTALLADISMIDLPADVSRKFRQAKGLSNLNAEDLEYYKQHPKASLTKVLTRKFQISETIKNALQSTHERYDKKGFPFQPRPEKIPMESFIVQICEELDQRTLLTIGREKKSIESAQQELFADLEKDPNRFPALLVTKLQSLVTK